MGHARAVATAPDPEALDKEIVAKGLSVRQTEDRAQAGEGKPGQRHDNGRASARNAPRPSMLTSMRSSGSLGTFSASRCR